jgi:hypothetical protein
LDKENLFSEETDEVTLTVLSIARISRFLSGSG